MCSLLDFYSKSPVEGDSSNRLYGLSATLIIYDDYEGYENAIKTKALWNNNLIEIGEHSNGVD